VFPAIMPITWENGESMPSTLRSIPLLPVNKLHG
jgi:hypothetical protein